MSLDRNRAKKGPSLDDKIGRWKDELFLNWDKLPAETRNQLTKAIGILPGDIKGWRKLIDQAVDQLRVAAGEKHRVAILGPANVGKSTLYNQLIRDTQLQAEVSPIPGTTKVSQEADAGLFQIIDTPGADAIGEVGMTEKERALSAAQAADVILLIYDASHGIRNPEKRLYGEVMALDKPTILVLNKIDLVKKKEAEVRGVAAASLGLPVNALVSISAVKGKGLAQLIEMIALREPSIVAALGAALPQYRWKLAQTAIGRASSTTAAIAATPLPLLDFIPLVGVQAAMVLGIARIYDYKITLARARELIFTFGLAMVGRTLFHELSKLGGPPGWLVAAAIAAGTTTAMGYASAVWFERGEKLSRETISRISKTVTVELMERLKSLGKKKPKETSLRESIARELDEIELPDPSPKE
jgi:small GTP-binding protein